MDKIGLARHRWLAVGLLVVVLASLVADYALESARQKRPAPFTSSAPASGSAPSRPSTRNGHADAEPLGWRELEAGLDLGVFQAPRKSELGDSRVRVLRIDPARFDLRLMNASAKTPKEPQTARQWCMAHNLVAAINASMYRQDHLTSVALMRTSAHVNNAAPSDDKTALVMEPTAAGWPPVRLADLETESLADLLSHYGTIVQSIRMISSDGRNVWSQQPRKWSTAAIGADGRGRILLIHCRSPYSVHDLIDILQALKIDIRQAMYVEGGPEAQLYVRSGPFELEAVGSYETGFVENDDNNRAWPVPNVIGVARIVSQGRQP